MKKIKLDFIFRKVYYFSMLTRLYIWITDRFLLKLFFDKISINKAIPLLCKTK